MLGLELDHVIKVATGNLVKNNKRWDHLNSNQCEYSIDTYTVNLIVISVFITTYLRN